MMLYENMGKDGHGPMHTYLRKGIAWLLIACSLLPLAACTPPKETAPITGINTQVSAQPAVGKEQEASAEGLVFTEAVSSSHLANPYEGCGRWDWFELYNGSGRTVDLQNFFVSDDPLKPNKRQLPAYMLAPGGYVAICTCGGSSHPSVELGLKKAGDTLYLNGTDGAQLDMLEIPALERDVSWAMAADGWGYCQEPTPGAANTTPIYSTLEATPSDTLNGLMLNELLISNRYSAVDEDGDCGDFVELYNGGPARSLKGLYLSDDRDTLTKWTFPEGNIGQGEYLVVFLDGKDKSGTYLHANFSVSAEEEGVFLYDEGTLQYTQLLVPSVIGADISFDGKGNYFCYPSPGRENGTGVQDISNLGVYDPEGVYISEVCASQKDGDDWVELHNGGRESVSLVGWVLTDSLQKDKYTFANVILEPGAYYVLSLRSGDPFGISKSGETLYLKDTQGNVQDRFLTGALERGMTSGRVEGDTVREHVFFSEATPGAANSTTYVTGYAATPVYSDTELYQTTAFSLTLTAEEGATIYYTTDGSKPTAASRVYTGPISISRNTVVRAYASQPGKLDSPMTAFTYLFEEPHSLPVVSIYLAPEDKTVVWSAKSKQSKTKVEREGYLTYYESDGRLGTAFPAGFKAKGAGTLGSKQPSLSIHLRGAYGQSKVTYPFFPEYGMISYGSLVVRNSGQDNTKARIRDSYASRLCLGLHIDVAATKPVVVYVNGQYYGLYDLNEDQNADFLETHYGVDKDKVEIIRYNQTVVRGSKTDWLKVTDYAENKDMTSDSGYEKFLQWVDEDYFIDYLICTIYLGNTDVANQKYWHTTDNAIRWRAIFYDFDYAMGYSSGVSRSMMGTFFTREGMDTATSHLKTLIPYGFSRNKKWREKFVERFVELVETVFQPQRCSRILDQLVSEMEPEMARHTKYWGSKYSPGSVSAWKKEIETIRSFMNQRPEQIYKQLKSYFRLSESELAALRSKYASGN